MVMRYWAVRPKTMPDQIRIEKAETSSQAAVLAFGRGTGAGWEAKDLGTRASVIQSDKRRIALLTSPDGWEVLT
jgi:hypothetical protein